MRKDILHHLFLPRESNNFRAKILHHTSLFLLIVSILFSSLLITRIERNHPGVLGMSASSVSISDLLTLTNAQRISHNLSPLTMNAALTAAAQAKASFMFQKNFWAHNSPDGITPWVFIKNANYQYVYAGENLARGFSSAADTVNAWMASPGHRENILSPNYKDIGFAVQAGSLTGEDTILVVQMFGSTNQAQTADTSVADSVTPTPVPEQPTVIQVQPTSIPLISVPPVPIVRTNTAVASLQTQPLVNKKPFTKHIALILVIILLVVLLIDIIVIEKNKIKRAFSHTHTIDHIIYLCVLLILIYILTKGVIL